MPRTGFEPATTTIILEKDRMEDLENFRLFTRAKLNLAKLTASQYICKLKPFLKDKSVVTDKDIQTYIQSKKGVCSAGYVSNVISAFKAYFREYKGLKIMDGYKHPTSPLRMKEEIKPGKVFAIGNERFLGAWNRARKKSGIYLKPKDLRDFFSQEMGKALIPDRYIDIFQGRAPRNILAKHYTTQGIRLLKEIYDKANLKVLK